MHNEGNVPKDDEETKPLMKAFEPLKVTPPPPSFTATHGSVSERGGIREEHMFPGALSSM